MPETLKGVIDRVTYHNPQNGFAVLRVTIKGRKDPVTLVGSTTSVTAGEHVEANGRWVIDRQHGQQFKADELKTAHPASAEGIEKSLASGAIRSIGPKPLPSLTIRDLTRKEEKSHQYRPINPSNGNEHATKASRRARSRTNHHSPSLTESPTLNVRPSAAQLHSFSTSCTQLTHRDGSYDLH